MNLCHKYVDESDIRDALVSRKPEDQSLVNEYGRLVEAYEMMYLSPDEGVIVACGALQFLAARVAAENVYLRLSSEAGQGGKVSDVLPANAKVIGSFEVELIDPPDPGRSFDA